MKNRRNFYRLLQVQPDAPTEIIRAAYRTLMLKLKHHPDLGGSTTDAVELNEAYEVLTDPGRRAAYDKELYLRYTKRAEVPDKSPLITVFCPVCKRPLARKPQPGARCASCQSPLQSEKPANHRRAYERALARTKRDDMVLYYTTWPGKPQQGKMIDFSPQGMRFLCVERLSPGTVLKIRSRFCDASGTVTNTVEEAAGGQKGYAIGIVFLAVNFAEPRGSFVSTSA
jgi:hypothetical protein